MRKNECEVQHKVIKEVFKSEQPSKFAKGTKEQSGDHCETYQINQMSLEWCLLSHKMKLTLQLKVPLGNKTVPLQNNETENKLTLTSVYNQNKQIIFETFYNYPSYIINIDTKF